MTAKQQERAKGRLLDKLIQAQVKITGKPLRANTERLLLGVLEAWLANVAERFNITEDTALALLNDWETWDVLAADGFPAVVSANR